MQKLLFDLSLLPLKAVNFVFDFYTGGKQREVFFDIDQTYPSMRSIDDKFEVVQHEMRSILPQRDRIPTYHELDAGQTEISAQTEHDWKVFMLYAMGEKPESNRAKCPQTAALLDEIPNLFQGFFSILDGGKSVPAHCGPYRGYIRYHLGLEVPANNPPSIRVKDQHYTWREGESVMFDDSWEHEVINHAEQIRVVLIVDVLRPMPWPFHKLNQLVTFLIRSFYAKSLAKKLR
ncbi:MAG: aspartyl/asparaginyl beta-hydroxylase domain-containing protein [Rubripirellula sp.]